MKISKIIKSNLIYYVFLLTVVFTFLTLIMLEATSKSDYSFDEDSIYDWSDDWTVSYGNTTEKDVSLPNKFDVKRGSVIILKKELPNKIKKYNSIMYESRRQDVIVHVGGVPRTTYSNKETRICGKTSPSSIVTVPLYSTDESADIAVLISSDSYRSGDIGKIYLGSEGSITIDLIKKNIPWLSLVVVLFLLGLINLISYFSFGKNFEEGKALINLFWMLFLSAIWCFSQLKIRQLFIKDIAVFENFGYCCHMIGIIPFVSLINYVTKYEHKRLYNTCEVITVINFFVQNIVQYFNIADFFDMHVITDLMVVFFVSMSMIIIACYYIKEKTKSKEYMLIALIGLFVCELAEKADSYYRDRTGFYFSIGMWFFTATYYVYVVVSAGKEQQRKKDAEAANIAKSQFLATMSHEIRTPINAVLGMNEMIIRDSNEEVIKGYARDVASAGKSLLSLVNDILDFSKIESGKMDIICVQYQMKSLLRDLILMIRGRISQNGLELKLNIDTNIPAVYFGDEIRIKQVLTNILTNAAKYTKEGSILFTVENRGIENDEISLFFSVKDTGMGIKEEDLERLMESSFIRVDQAKNRNIEGTGLGLSITRQLLTLMGSKLEVKSVYGEGSEFYFTIKQKIIDTKPMGEVISSERGNDKEDVKKQTFKAPSVKVLAVDDTRTNLIVIKGLLKPYEMQVDICDSGEKCLEMCKDTYYDVILMDHMMPGMDGIETLNILRSNNELKSQESKVIALTANAISGAADLYSENGFDGYMTKPIDVVDLDTQMRNVLKEEQIIPV